MIDFSKLKKYKSLNAVSVIGYFGIIICAVFVVFYCLASSGVYVGGDSFKFYFSHLVSHVLKPYLDFYGCQLLVVFILLTVSYFERNYYIKNNLAGFKIFENREREYSIIFTTGFLLNFLPLYLMLPVLGVKLQLLLFL